MFDDMVRYSLETLEERFETRHSLERRCIYIKYTLGRHVHNIVKSTSYNQRLPFLFSYPT